MLSVRSSSIALACFVAVLGAVVDPARLHPTLELWPPPLDLGRAPAFVLSPVFLLCAFLSTAGCLYIGRSSLSPSDQSVTTWWWLNVTWFLTACDMSSGLLMITPNLTELYQILNRDHSLPRFHPERVVMDTIYCVEIVTLPLLCFTIWLYFRRDPARYVLDALLAGGQVCGAVAYYVPDIILGEHTSVITNVDRGIASFWVVIDAWIFFRAVAGVRALAAAGREKAA